MQTYSPKHYYLPFQNNGERDQGQPISNAYIFQIPITELLRSLAELQCISLIIRAEFTNRTFLR